MLAETETVFPRKMTTTNETHGNHPTTWRAAECEEAMDVLEHEKDGDYEDIKLCREGGEERKKNATRKQQCCQLESKPYRPSTAIDPGNSKNRHRLRLHAPSESRQTLLRFRQTSGYVASVLLFRVATSSFGTFCCSWTRG